VTRLHSFFIRLTTVISVIAVLLFLSFPAEGLAGTEPRSGLFLVATDQLQGTSFQETVILLTHYSEHGATGLAINRPTDIPLSQAFPHIEHLHEQSDPLFLGGPVRTNAIFVLVHTFEPNEGMRHITDNLYFSTGRNAFGFPLKGKAHAYAGYAGWSPGQLKHEIRRGDWLVVKTNPSIVFDKNLPGLWQRLKNRWSGDWI
jgi:putative transcriptional regulator